MKQREEGEAIKKLNNILRLGHISMQLKLISF